MVRVIALGTMLCSTICAAVEAGTLTATPVGGLVDGINDIEINGKLYDAQITWGGTFTNATRNVGDLPDGEIDDAISLVLDLFDSSTGRNIWEPFFSSDSRLTHRIYFAPKLVLETEADIQIDAQFTLTDANLDGPPHILSGNLGPTQVNQSSLALTSREGTVEFQLNEAAVPEPSSAILLGFATAVGCLAYRRRQATLANQPEPNSANS